MRVRSGPYSLVTQQPLGGKAQFGGQRLGEMEVWAIEAYGAAYVLAGDSSPSSPTTSPAERVCTKPSSRARTSSSRGFPESFNVLVKELQALGLELMDEQ